MSPWVCFNETVMIRPFDKRTNQWWFFHVIVVLYSPVALKQFFSALGLSMQLKN